MIEQEFFARDEILPSWFVNRIQHRLAPLTKIRLRRANATTVEVSAGADDDAAVVNIAGNWRFVEAAEQAAHPGGAAGIYRVFVTAAEQDIATTPDPNTDLTDYSFGLAIVPDGGTPTIVPGTVDIFRLVAKVWWDGAAINSLVQIVGAQAFRGIYSVAWNPPSVPAGGVATLTVNVPDVTAQHVAMASVAGLGFDGAWLVNATTGEGTVIVVIRNMTAGAIDLGLILVTGLVLGDGSGSD